MNLESLDSTERALKKNFREASAFIHIVQQSFGTVTNTTNLPWEVRKRILKKMERAVRECLFVKASGEDFAAWCELEMADLLENEDIRPLCRLELASWFASEIVAHLSGNFDDESAA